VKLLRTAFHHLEGEGQAAQFGSPIRPPIHINFLRATPESDEDQALFPLLIALLTDSVEWIKSGVNHEESRYITERVRLIQTIAYVATYKSFRHTHRTEALLPVMIQLLEVCSPYDWAPFDRMLYRLSECIGYLVILGPLETSPFHTVLSTIPGVNFTGEQNPAPPTSEAFKAAKKDVKTKIEEYIKKATDVSDPNQAVQAAKVAIALLGTYLVVEPSICKTYFSFLMDWLEDPNPAMKTLCLWCLHQAVDSPPIISRNGGPNIAPHPEPLPTVSATQLRGVMDTYMSYLEFPNGHVKMMAATALNSPNLIMTLSLCQKEYLGASIIKLLEMVVRNLNKICFGGSVEEPNWRCFQVTLDALAGNFGVWATCPLPPISTVLRDQLEGHIMFVMELLIKTNSNRDSIQAAIKALKKPEKVKRRKTLNSLRSATDKQVSNNFAPSCLLPVSSSVVSLREYCARAVIKANPDTSALPTELNEYIEHIKQCNGKLTHEIQVSLLNLFRALCVSGFQDTAMEHKTLSEENAYKFITMFSTMEVPPQQLLATARAVDRLVSRLPPMLDAAEVSKLLPLLTKPLTTQLSTAEATDHLQHQMLTEVFAELLMSNYFASVICDPLIQFVWEYIGNSSNSPSLRYTASELLKGLIVEDQPWYISGLTTKLQRGWMSAFGRLLADWNNSQYEHAAKHLLDECLDNLSEMFELLFEDKERLFKSLFKKTFPNSTADQAETVFAEFVIAGDQPNLQALVAACGITPSKKRKRNAFRDGALYSKTEPNKDESEDEDDYLFPPFHPMGPLGLFGFPGFDEDDQDDSDSDGLHADYGIPTCFHNHVHEEDSDSDIM